MEEWENQTLWDLLVLVIRTVAFTQSEESSEVQAEEGQCHVLVSKGSERAHTRKQAGRPVRRLLRSPRSGREGTEKGVGYLHVLKTESKSVAGKMGVKCNRTAVLGVPAQTFSLSS